MISRTSLLLLPILALAQQQAPPEVDRELRARVSAFYQNFVNGSPRKAEPFVAEDTKEFYYNAGKQHYDSFKIGKITYSDDFTKAVVVVIGKMERLIGGHAVMMDTPQDTHWKIENGKWCWTYNQADYPITPIQDKNPPPATPDDRAAAMRPKNTSPEAIREAGASVLEQQTMTLDKSSLTVTSDQEWTTQVVFSNGADGEVQIALDGPVVRGLTTKLEKTIVPGHGTSTLTLHFDPSNKKGAKDVWEPTGIIPFRILAAPFNRSLSISVMFTTAK